MDGYPIHNYGTDPLGRMGMQMIQSSLDWNEKKKVLERQALSEAAQQREGAFMKTVEAGTAPPGVANKLYGADIGQGIDAMNKQKQLMNYIKELTDTADYAKKKQDYQAAEITKNLASLDYWKKQHTEYYEAGKNVVSINDNIDMVCKKLEELTGQKFDGVRMTDISEIKKFKESVAIGEVSKLEAQLTKAMTDGDLKAAGAAASALGSQIMTSSKQLGVSKDTFASATEALKQFQQELPKMLAEKVKPKPTYETKVLPDGTRIQTEVGTGKESLVQGRTPRESVTDDIAFKKKAQYVSQVMKIPEAEAVQMVLQGKQKSKQQFVSDAVQAQVALGMKPKEIQKTIAEMGKIYDIIQGNAPLVPEQEVKTGKKDYKYLWEK